MQANGWHALAQGLFTVGVYFGVTFGSLIVGRLMTEQRLSDARFPTLAVLMVPPATASTAWFGLNDNRITTFGIGLAAVLAMMALIQLFILPDYPSPTVHDLMLVVQRPVGLSGEHGGPLGDCGPESRELAVDLVDPDNCHHNHWLARAAHPADGVENFSVGAGLARRPLISHLGDVGMPSLSQGSVPTNEPVRGTPSKTVRCRP